MANAFYDVYKTASQLENRVRMVYEERKAMRELKKMKEFDELIIRHIISTVNLNPDGTLNIVLCERVEKAMTTVIRQII
jgi:hypothetical protein